MDLGIKDRVALVAGVSVEVAIDNVTINNVAPSYTLTERHDEVAATPGRALGQSREEKIAVWASQVPMRRLARPDEIAAAVAFFASERTSYITASRSRLMAAGRGVPRNG